MTINGHPALELEGPQGPVMITVCAECEQLRTVLWLSGDRWFCTACRNAGDARPTFVPLTSRPSERK